MELSQEILKGLELLGDFKQLPDQAFKELVQVCFGVAVNEISEKRVEESIVLSKLDKIEVKQCLASLLSFVLEAAKINADPQILQGILEENKVDQNRIVTITQLYSQMKTSIRNYLSSSSFHLPRIVDVDWRLDYFMKSNSLEKVNAPVYFISLQTKETQNESEEESVPVNFSCTHEQLQDLVTKLKDATKQVERSASNL